MDLWLATSRTLFCNRISRSAFLSLRRWEKKFQRNQKHLGKISLLSILTTRRYTRWLPLRRLRSGICLPLRSLQSQKLVQSRRTVNQLWKRLSHRRSHQQNQKLRTLKQQIVQTNSIKKINQRRLFHWLPQNMQLLIHLLLHGQRRKT